MNHFKTAVAVAVLAYLATTTGAQSANRPTLRVALICGAMTAMVAQVAMNDESLERAGLHVEKYCFPGGAPAVQALVGRSVDVYIGSFEHVLRQRAHGFDVKAYGEIYDGICCAVMAKANSPIRTLADLRGQVVGITVSGSISETILRKALQSARLNPDRDLTIVNIGQGTPMYAALESNRIAAGLVPEPMMTELAADGAYRILFGFNTPFAGAVLMANVGWVNSHRQEMRELLATLHEVATHVRANPSSAVVPLHRDFPNVPPRIMLQAIMHELRFVPTDLRVQPKGAATILQLELELGDLKTPIPFGQSVDNSLVASAP